MIKRSECLYNGQIVGIETIYTVIDGKQINIPNKVETLRKLGRENQLFCPCGCGANLILVAGDRNLREQHFRIKSAGDCDCHAVTEGEYSVNSKIVLKCWLDDKIKQGEVEARVPINSIDDSNRKYEFSLLNKEASIAISYYRDRTNLTDEKLTILDENASGISLQYICDISNKGTDEQYPEMMIKIQNRQGYCLFLDPEGMDYSRARMIVSLYVQDYKGLWQEIDLTNGRLTEYSFSNDSCLLYGNQLVEHIAKERIAKHVIDTELAQEEAKKREEEIIKRYKAEQDARQRQKEEAQKRWLSQVNTNILNNSLKDIGDKPGQLSEEEKRRIGLEDVKPLIKERVARAMDRFEVRWAQCTACGEIKPGTEFSRYGANQAEGCLGLCKTCFEAGRREWTLIPRPERLCPKCGSRLVVRKGRYGEFWGCSNYPNCNYTERL